jgi:hypothetical protein
LGRGGLRGLDDVARRGLGGVRGILEELGHLLRKASHLGSQFGDLRFQFSDPSLIPLFLGRFYRPLLLSLLFMLIGRTPSASPGRPQAKLTQERVITNAVNGYARSIRASSSTTAR